MTILHFLIDITGGILGILLHIFLFKLPAHKKRCAAAKIPFSEKQYLKDDKIAIIGAFLTVITVTYFLDEAIHAYPKLVDYVKFFMVFMGYTGSSILISTFGKASGKVLDIMGVKSEVANNAKPDNQ